MYMGQGVQLLTVGRWAGCPADSGYVRAGGPADFHVNTYMYWARYTAQTTVHFTCVYHREEKVWLQFHTICCKFLLSPFVMRFQLGCRICLRGPKSTLKSMRSSKNGHL